MVDHGLSQAQRNNLMRLAIYLDTLPEDYREFDMTRYFTPLANDNKNKLEKRYARKNGGVASCGTSACAVGHGPSAGIPVPKRFITRDLEGDWEVDWSKYSTLFCPKYDGVSMVWIWLFCASWSRFDRHHYGAAARIKYILMGEALPENFGYPSPSDVVSYSKYRKQIV